MSSKTDKVSVDLAIKVLGNWKETYGWIPIFAAIASVLMSFWTGANNLPAPFSSPIGSGILTLPKTFVMACVICIPTTSFANSTSTVNDLFSNFVKENQPSEGFLMWSLVVVPITAAIWLALATYLQLPVSSLRSIQRALLGTILVTQGFDYIPLWNKNQNHNFTGGGLVWIVLEWTVAPLISFVIAFFLFALMKVSLLRPENPEKRILVFLPIDYGMSAGLLCLFLMYQIFTSNSRLVIVAVAGATLTGALLSLLVVVPLAMKKLKAAANYKTMKRNMTRSSDHSKCMESQDPTFKETKSADDEAQFEEAMKDFMQMRVLDTVYEEDERSWASPDSLVQEPEKMIAEDQSPGSQDQSNTDKSTSFRKFLESTPNRLVHNQSRNFQKIEKTTPNRNAFLQFLKTSSNSFFSPVMEYDRHTLIRHALAEKFDEVENFFRFPHLVASCIFVVIQSAGEISAVASPYGTIIDIFHKREKYSGHEYYPESVYVNPWFKAVSGFGAAIGFFLCGFRLTQSLGGKLTYMRNSRGLAAQLSTVVAIFIVTGINLPVSTIHALVGSLVGVGVADDHRNVNWKLLFKFVCGWVMTIVFCSVVAFVMFSASVHSPSYVIR